jgi:hypothetical protein
LKPATILECATSIQTRARQQAILGCGKSRLVLQHLDFVARRDDFLLGEEVPPVTAYCSRRFGCGEAPHRFRLAYNLPFINHLKHPPPNSPKSPTRVHQFTKITTYVFSTT